MCRHDSRIQQLVAQLDQPVAKPELLYDDESGEARNIESIEAGVRNPMSFTGNGNYLPNDRPNTGIPPGAFDT